METLILSLIPVLSDYPFMLVVTEITFAFFFGGFIFSAFWNLVKVMTGGRE